MSKQGYYEGDDTHPEGEYDPDGQYVTSNDPHPRYLGGRSPYYWVCAHANNQHELGAEITSDPSQTSFYRALMLSKGTVSVLDASAICYDRIWCVYELFVSLQRPQAAAVLDVPQTNRVVRRARNNDITPVLQAGWKLVVNFNCIFFLFLRKVLGFGNIQ